MLERAEKWGGLRALEKKRKSEARRHEAEGPRARGSVGGRPKKGEFRKRSAASERGRSPGFGTCAESSKEIVKKE